MSFQTLSEKQQRHPANSTYTIRIQINTRGQERAPLPAVQTYAVQKEYESWMGNNEAVCLINHFYALVAHCTIEIILKTT